MRVHVVADARRRRRRNGERRIGRVVVDEGVLAVAEVTRIVVVQQVIVARLAMRIDRPRQAGEIIDDRPHAGLTRIRAVGVGAAAVDGRVGIWRRIAGVVTGSVAVFRVPVVGAARRIGILDLVDDAGVRRALEHLGAVRRHGRLTVRVAEPDHVAVAEHDVVRARAAVDGLVEVVAHRVLLDEAREVRHVALLHVVEAESGRALTGRGGARQVVRAEAPRSRAVGVARSRLRDAIRAGPDGHLDPGEELLVAA